MDWITGIQRALDYVEEHITEPIDYEEAARRACSSSFHFQRVFSVLCGFTLGEYIRLRRLTLWMLACLTAVCLLPGRTEAGGKPSAGGTDPSAPGGSQSNGQTGQKGRITGEPGGARVLYFKKERDE